MKVAIEDLTAHFNAAFIEADGHRRRPLLRHYVYLVWPLASRSHLIIGSRTQSRSILVVIPRTIHIPTIGLSRAWCRITDSGEGGQRVVRPHPALLVITSCQALLVAVESAAEARHV